MRPLNLTSPHLIIMVGIPGSGKSFFAEHFASTFSAPYLDFEKIGTEIFGEQTRDNEQQTAVGRAASYLLAELLKTNQTIVYEGPTDAASARLEIARLARAKGYQPLFVWVQTESAASKARVGKASRGHMTIDSDQFDAKVRRFTPPSAAEKAVVISGKHTYPSQLKIVLKRLAEGHPKAELQPIVRDDTARRHIAIR